MRKEARFRWMLFILMTIPSLANAGWLVNGAKISGIANIANDIDHFEVSSDGSGTGVCENSAVFFKVQNMPDQSKDALARAVAIASTAFAMDLYIYIYNYDGDNCDGASYIKVSKTPL